MDYYLKFPDEAAMLDAFGTTSIETGHGTVTTHPLVQHMAVDIIGTIYEQTGEVQTVDGMDVPVYAPLDGWHVNLRGDALPPGLEQYIVNPTNPRRVWA